MRLPMSRSAIMFAFNGDSGTATVINARNGALAGTYGKLGGAPEFAVADADHVFVNLEDKNQLAENRFQ